MPLIYQWAMSKEMWTAFGPNVGTAFNDQTHLNGYGGYLLSKLIIRGIKAGVPELAKFVADDFQDMEPAHPEAPPEYLKQSPGPGTPVRVPQQMGPPPTETRPAATAPVTPGKTP